MSAKEVSDLKALNRALTAFAPELRKQMNTEIMFALKGIQKKSRDLVPLSMGSGLRNFQQDGLTHKSRSSRARAFPRYNAAEVKKGIVIRRGKQTIKNSNWVGYYSLINKSAAGAIVETAGRLHRNGDPASQSNNPNAGAHFINVIDHQVGGIAKYGKGRKQSGRLIFRAAEEDRGKTRDAIQKAIQKAKVSLYEQMRLAA